MSSYQWEWFDLRNADEFNWDGLSIPAQGAYGVRVDRLVICLTSRYKRGYDRARAIADELNIRDASRRG